MFRIVVLVLWLLAPAISGAQELAENVTANPEFVDAPNTNEDATSEEEEDEEEPDEAQAPAITEEGREEFEDVASLQALEATSLQPLILGDDTPWTGKMLAPFVGTWNAILQDAGKVPELQQGHVPSGSELLSIASVRKRFEATSMLGLTVHDQPSVRAYLDFFDGRGKPILANWIARMGRFEPLIRETLRAEGLPEDLIFVAMIESGFSPRATSPAAAVGVWQFIPTTGSEMGLTINRYVDERRDPVKATRAAALYLKRLYDRFGSWPLALASYNGGPGLMSSNISRFNSNDFWHIQRLGGLYDESRRYVPKIIAAGLVTKNADVFGLSGIKKVPPYTFDVVEVPGNVRLQLFADALGVSVDTLRDLNPELLLAQTPPDSKTYDLRIPAGTTATFIKNYDGLERREGLEHDEYVVKFGETLKDVAGKFDIPPRILASVNGLKPKERVSYGQTIIVPKHGRGTYKGRSTSSQVLVVPQTTLKVEGRVRRLYRVNAGDTLDAIAHATGVKTSDLLVWNFVDGKAKLQPGMILQIFIQDADPDGVALIDPEKVKIVVAGTPEAERVQRKTTVKRRYYHKVRNGESLWIIARKYRVTVGDLKKWNRSIGRKNMLQPGQKLVVYPGKRKRR